MMNSYKFLTALVLGCVLMWSCGDDDAGKTETMSPLPRVKITSPVNSATVRGTVNVKASASILLGGKISKLVLLVDNVSVKEVADTMLAVEWDSKTVSDGTHTLKVLATSDKDRTAEASVSVVVDNTPVLIEFIVPANATGLPYWVFASDEKGNVIDISQVKVGTTVRLYRKKGFVGDTFTLTTFEDGSVNSIPYGFFRSVTGCKAGTYTVLSKGEPAAAGTASILFNDFPAGRTSDYVFSSPSMSYSVDFATGATTYSGGLSSNPVAYLYAFVSEEGSKYMTGKLSAGDKITRSVSEDMAAMAADYINIPKGNSVMITMGGNRVDGFYSSYCRFRASLFSERTKPLYYPHVFFDSYTVTLQNEVDNDTYYQTVAKTKTLPKEMEYLNAAVDNVSFSGNGSRVDVTGSCDFVRLSSRAPINNTLNEYWEVYSAPNVLQRYA